MGRMNILNESPKVVCVQNGKFQTFLVYSKVNKKRWPIAFL